MREFSLVNELGERYPLNGENGTYFFNPEGLGVSFDNENSRIANGFFKLTNRNEAPESISGTLIFTDHKATKETVLHNIDWDGVNKYGDYSVKFIWSEGDVSYTFELFKVAEARDIDFYTRADTLNFAKVSYKAQSSNFTEYTTSLCFDFSWWAPEIGENKAIVVYDFDSSTDDAIVKAIIFTESCVVQEQHINAGIYLLAVPLVVDDSGNTMINRHVSNLKLISRDNSETEVTAYSSYREFISFIENAKELRLSYKPEDIEYFTDITVETLEKTELAQEFTLPVKITMNRLSMWYIVQETVTFQSSDTVFYHDIVDIDSTVDHVEVELDVIDVSFYGSMDIGIEDLDTGETVSVCELFHSQVGDHFFPLVCYSSKTGSCKIKIISNTLVSGRPVEFDGVQYAELSSDVFVSREGGKASRVFVQFGDFSEVQHLTMRAILYYRSI